MKGARVANRPLVATFAAIVNDILLLSRSDSQKRRKRKNERTELGTEKPRTGAETHVPACSWDSRAVPGPGAGSGPVPGESGTVPGPQAPDQVSPKAIRRGPTLGRPSLPGTQSSQATLGWLVTFVWLGNPHPACQWRQ